MSGYPKHRQEHMISPRVRPRGGRCIGYLYNQRIKRATSNDSCYGGAGFIFPNLFSWDGRLLRTDGHQCLFLATHAWMDDAVPIVASHEVA